MVPSCTVEQTALSPSVSSLRRWTSSKSTDIGGTKLENIVGYVRIESHGPEIHAPTLLEDFAAGWVRYLAAVRSSSASGDLGRKFERRFDEIFRD
jgi:hypothetical protein